MNINRRQALKGAAAFGTFQIVPRRLLGGPGYIPPSEELTRGIIGCGGISRAHLGYRGARIVGLCDVDQSRLKDRIGQCQSKGNKSVTGHNDFREMIARDDIDIITVATPPHWHGLMSIAAAEAGKDVWCEKPMTRTIAEGQRVIEACKRNGTIFRINTWFRFTSNFYGFGSTVKEIKKVVESGLLGGPLKVTVGVGQGFNWKHNWNGKTSLPPQDIPAGFNYNMWLGPAPYKPYSRHRTHGTFRGYWDYDGGGLGDMGMHYLDPVQYIMGKDETGPVKVEVDTNDQHPDAVSSWRRIVLTYADGTELHLDGDGSLKDKPFLEGPKGKLFRGFKSDIPNLRETLKSLPDPAPQNDDFYKCVRTREKFALNEENAHRSTSIINLAKIGLRLNRTLHYDPVKQQFVNDNAANNLVDQPMRSPWNLI
jgi:myo-inositol 2-dehydrogenase / D-chiro-inositol 1-dehydrogenase